MAYTTINKPSDHFETKIWTGNGSSQDISLDFAPDWIWIKQRSATRYHNLQDTIRGTGLQLFSNTTSADNSDGTNITAFNSDGYSLGAGDNVNKNTSTYVGWSWKAGGSASSNSDGNITSSVSVNTTAGFSIVSYTGTGGGKTVGHGLGVAPRVFFMKNRGSADYNWSVWHADLATPTTARLGLNVTSAQQNHSSYWNDGVPSATILNLGSDAGHNANGDTYIAYCFAEKKGYSKFGTYEGNGIDDGPFIYTGFAPAFVMVKCFDQGEHWNIYDNKRGSSVTLSPNLNNVDRAMDDSPAMELLSNGFKIRTSDNNLSNAADGFIYMAFAAEPFVTSKGVPATAK
jgi:hypothetical protein